MNAGLNISRYPLFCAVDGDSILEKDALLKVVRPFLEDPERTIGAGGIIRLSNGCVVQEGQVVEVGIPRNWIARFQILEYLRAFLGGRLGMSMMKSTLIISGAFGIFRKDMAMACGGYRAASITEDMDLVIRMQKHMHEQKKPYRIQFIPDPDLLDRGPGEPPGPGPAEEPLAPRAHPDPGPLPADALQPALRRRRHVRHALLRGLRDGRALTSNAWATSCSRAMSSSARSTTRSR